MSAKPKKLDMAAILADTANRVLVCCGRRWRRKDHHRGCDGVAGGEYAAPLLF